MIATTEHLERKTHGSGTLVLGVGNPILTDDGVGVRVAGLVAAALAGRAVERVDVASASAGGLALMEALLGYRRAILIDALVWPGEPPGALHRLTLDDLRSARPTEHSTSSHDTSLVAALELGRQIGLPLPGEVVVYAVAVENVVDFGDEPTPAVAAAIPQAAAAVLAELRI